MTESSCVQFAQGDYKVLLHEPKSYSDWSGYHHLVELVAGPFRGIIDAESYGGIAALTRFHDALVQLYQSLSGEAVLDWYENFSLRLVGDGRGHILVQVKAMAGPSIETRLTYEFGLDQTYLPEAIGSLARLTSGRT
jgi:hypothetical protein